MNIEHISPVAMTVGGGFLAGILIGYALKKMVKLVAVVIGLFFAGIAYLQYQQIFNINWNKLQAASQNAVTNLANATTQISGLSTTNHTAALAISNFGIPLTSSMSMGIAIGFLKG